MNFVNIKFSTIVKILAFFLVGIILIRLIPILIVLGLVVWGGFKCIKYFNGFTKSEDKSKFKEKERVYNKSRVYDDKNNFDLSDKNVVDVEYEEIKK